MVDTGAMTPSDWDEVDGALERTFEFPGFVESIAFVNRLGELAESENHHPDIAIVVQPRDGPLVDAYRRRDHGSRPRPGGTDERPLARTWDLDDDHRARGVGDDVPADRAEQRSGQTGASVRADDDKVRLLALGDEGLAGVPFDGALLDSKPGFGSSDSIALDRTMFAASFSAVS